MKIESELKKQYFEKVRGELLKELKLENVMAVPNITSIIVNCGLGEGKENPSIIDEMAEDIAMITGQKPVVTKAKDAVSNFKIRKGMPIGLKVTLRGARMWFFLEKLIHIVLPRVKDFRGVSKKAFDGNGNYSLGIREHLVFPEIDPTKVTKPRGFQVVICTSATNDDHAKKLLEKFRFPFVK